MKMQRSNKLYVSFILHQLHYITLKLFRVA